MKYINVLPELIKVANASGLTVYGNSFPVDAEYPSSILKYAGGYQYTRIQVVSRSDDELESMDQCISLINFLESNLHRLNFLALELVRESNVITDYDDTTKKQETWCYLRLEHMEG